MTEPTPPQTAKKRGRKPGPISPTVKWLLSQPFNEWVTWHSESADNVAADARSVRNASQRHNFNVSVLTDREDGTAIHVLKKGNDNGTQE